MIAKQHLALCIFGLFISQCALSVAPNTIIGTVTDSNSTFNHPINISITSNGKTAYVLNSGNDTISIVDIATNKVTGIVTDSGTTLNHPVAIAITPDDKKAYIINQAHSTVSILDIATNTITGIVASGNFSTPADIAITLDGTTAYVTNPANNTVSIIDVATNTATGIVSDLGATLDMPKSIAISLDGTQAFVTNAHTVSIITIATNTINVDGTVSNIFGSDTPYDIVFIPNSVKSYLSSFNQNEIFVIFGDTAITGFSVLGVQNLIISPDGTTVYAMQNTNNISVINTANDTVTGVVSDPLATLNVPYNLAITPDGFTGYIVNLEGNSVSIMFIKDPPLTIFPPISIAGCKTKNIFLAQTDLINFITWNAPAIGLAPAKYNIFRDAALTDLIVTIPATEPLQYYDHNRDPNITYIYYIVSLDQNGNISTPSNVTVTSSCQ